MLTKAHFFLAGKYYTAELNPDARFSIWEGGAQKSINITDITSNVISLQAFRAGGFQA